MDGSNDKVEAVWEITGADGIYGYVVWSGGRNFLYDMTPNIGALIKNEIAKTSDIPEEILGTVLHDFFSLYLQRLSGGAVRGKLLPEEAPTAPTHQVDLHEIAQIEPNDGFLYLRRFNGVLPTAGLAAEICSPGRLTMVAAVNLTLISRCVLGGEPLLSRYHLATTTSISLDHESWVRDVSRLANSVRGVLIDVNLFDQRSESSKPTGLHAEMALSLMLMPTVARAYLKHPRQTLPVWLPPALAVSVSTLDLFITQRRQRIVAQVRKILAPGFQRQFEEYFDNCRARWKRAIVLDDTQIESGANGA